MKICLLYLSYPFFGDGVENGSGFRIPVPVSYFLTDFDFRIFQLISTVARYVCTVHVVQAVLTEGTV